MGGMNMPADSPTTAKSSAASSATLELTTDPSPPKKGSNTVTVKLTAKDGKAIDGAKVTVTFFMPAMPDMGMAAMKTVIAATGTSGGNYEGKGDIGSGGDWQVTVKATKAGHVIATKKLTLNVAGGM
jgi:Cu(I)/Ag(I) efflux system membrane fusion protein/cobalt-zinc-cadmium efflux system membrane fusion protein